MWAFHGNLWAKGDTSRQETIGSNEEAQPTLGPWTGFEPVRLETLRTSKHAWFHCTTAAPTLPYPTLT
ncbi:hypothetical protein E2C01_099923 [Portunus trituberculatus]|uniref:Uncharacterized protein n=1 Tax=Portunus trituberculatus TaxID=210409 RepID=A0A5B7KBM4_PORTR|nr:hypothetical protein [Portunus trituberculatus]